MPRSTLVGATRERGRAGWPLLDRTHARSRGAGGRAPRPQEPQSDRRDVRHQGGRRLSHAHWAIQHASLGHAIGRCRACGSRDRVHGTGRRGRDPDRRLHHHRSRQRDTRRSRGRHRGDRCSPVGPSGEGTQVAIESRVGFPVMTRVTGELQPSLRIEPVRASTTSSPGTPFSRAGSPRCTSSSTTATSDSGSRRSSRARAATQVRDPEAPAARAAAGRTARGHRIHSRACGRIFFAPVQISAEPTVVTPDGDPQSADAVVQQTGAWTIPAAAAAGTRRPRAHRARRRSSVRRRSKQKVEAMVADAREAGRREVQS